MQLGLSNHPRFDISLEGFLNFASQLRAEHVELKLDCPFLLSALYNKDEIRGIKNLFASYSFKYFLHTPTIDINLASLNPGIGEVSEKITLEPVHFADKIDAELIVSHVGRLSRDHLENLSDLAFRNAVSRLKHLVHVSEDLGITFTIENDHKASDRILAGYPKQVYSLIRTLGCKLTFDVGHANTLEEIEGFLNSLGKEMLTSISTIMTESTMNIYRLEKKNKH